MAVGDLGRELVEPLCSAPDARASFLLRRQKKRAKEKATPGRRPACGGVPCATRLERGLRNSGCALRQCSRTSPLKPALLGTSQGDFNTDRSSLRSVFLLSSASSSSAENPAQPGDAAGARFLWVLSFGKTKESTSPAGETQRFSPPPPPENTKRQETWQMAHPE